VRKHSRSMCFQAVLIAAVVSAAPETVANSLSSGHHSQLWFTQSYIVENSTSALPFRNMFRRGADKMPVLFEAGDGPETLLVPVPAPKGCPGLPM
jgi:hypothetical protein